MNVLMLGGPNTGKSTFLVQLYGRIDSQSGRLVARGAPADLTPIKGGLERLASGLSLEHTRPATQQVVQHLPAATSDGEEVDFDIPEYAGETLDELVRRHRIPERWRSLISQSNQWLLFVRLEQFAELPELLTKPIGEQEAGPANTLGSAHSDTDDDPEEIRPEPDVGDDSATIATPNNQIDLPLDMRLVELLQMALHARAAKPRGAVTHPALTVVLSCWDECGVEKGDRPEDIASARIPLLHRYVWATWRPEALEFLGLSSQGCHLQADTPDETFVDNTPARQGYLVTEDGKHERDLTLVVRAP